MAGALVLCEHLASERDSAVKERDAARAELHAATELVEEFRKRDAAATSTIARLITERDTAVAKASQ
jgi:hypothetical protein